MNILKCCTVFLLEDGSILIEGADYMPSGSGWLTSNARVRLSPEVFKDLLGPVVLNVLDQTKVTDGANQDEKQVLAGRYRFSGAKSNRAFTSKSRCLNLSIKEEKLQITPTASEHGGYRFLAKKKALCALDAGEVRDLILSKFDECE